MGLGIPRAFLFLASCTGTAKRIHNVQRRGIGVPAVVIQRVSAHRVRRGCQSTLNVVKEGSLLLSFGICYGGF